MSQHENDDDSGDQTTKTGRRVPVNFRDVGNTLKALCSDARQGGDDDDERDFLLPPPGCIYRGGSPDGIEYECLGGQPPKHSIRSLLNLRAEPSHAYLLQQAVSEKCSPGDRAAAQQAVVLLPRDAVDLHGKHGVLIFQEATEDRAERYDVSLPEVRSWVCRVLKIVETAPLPIYLSCMHGRDRTGVVVAAILLCLNVPPDLVLAEYVKSDNPKVELFTTLTLPGFMRGGAAPAPAAKKAGGAAASTGDSDNSPFAAMKKYVRGSVNIDKLRERFATFGEQKK